MDRLIDSSRFIDSRHKLASVVSDICEFLCIYRRFVVDVHSEDDERMKTTFILEIFY